MTDISTFLIQAQHDAEAAPASCISEDVFQTIQNNKRMSSVDLVNLRRDRLREVKTLAADTAAENQLLIKSLPPSVQSIHAKSGCNLVLLRKLLQQYAYPDADVVSMLERGFDNRGCVPSSGLLEPETREKFCLPRNKRARRQFLRVGRPMVDSAEDTLILYRHFSQLLADGLATEVSLVESQCSESLYPTYPFVQRREGKKNRIIVDDRPRNFDAVL